MDAGTPPGGPRRSRPIGPGCVDKDVGRLGKSAAVAGSSGLGYLPLKGTGTSVQHATENDSVHINYKVWSLSTHELLDSNIGKPPSFFVLSMMVPGWREAVRLMTPGDTARFWVPAKLANKGQGALLMDIELVSIEPGTCEGSFHSGEDLAITLTGDARGPCGNFVFIDTSGANPRPMCAGRLVCDGAYSLFEHATGAAPEREDRLAVRRQDPLGRRHDRRHHEAVDAQSGQPSPSLSPLIVSGSSGH